VLLAAEVPSAATWSESHDPDLKPPRRLRLRNRKFAAVSDILAPWIDQNFLSA
jgi:hypothetical protein